MQGLRSHEDALEVVKAMDAKPKNPVVVGGGYIGLEVAMDKAPEV